MISLNHHNLVPGEVAATSGRFMSTAAKTRLKFSFCVTTHENKIIHLCSVF